MGDLIRFGRRVPLPSSVQVLHDLLVMERNEKTSQPDSPEQIKAKSDSEMGVASAALRIPPQG